MLPLPRPVPAAAARSSWPTSRRSAGSSCTRWPPPGSPPTAWSTRQRGMPPPRGVGRRGPLRRRRPLGRRGPHGAAQPDVARRAVEAAAHRRRHGGPHRERGQVGGGRRSQGSGRGSRPSPRAAGRAAGSWPAAELALAVEQLVLARQSGDPDAALAAAAEAQALLHVQDPARVAAHPEIEAVVEANVAAAHVLAGRSTWPPTPSPPSPTPRTWRVGSTRTSTHSGTVPCSRRGPGT